MTPRALDWLALLRAGLQTLRLKPSEFWSLTPAELGLMLGLDVRALPMSRAELDDLHRLYPDGAPPPRPEDPLRLLSDERTPQ